MAFVAGPNDFGVLYLSYDGMCDHIAQSQVLPYVVGLARRGVPMTLVSHEKPDAPLDKRAKVGAMLAKEGVTWLPQTYLRGNAIAALGPHLAMEVAAALRSSRKAPIRIAHARGYIPAMAAAVLSRTLGAKMLFDMRGFWFDEKIDAGSWKKGRVYEAGKKLERSLFSRANAIVSLTHAAKRELESWDLGKPIAPITVIPTCLDVSAYHGASKRRADRGPVLGYVGSFGARYLTDEMMDLVSRVRVRAPDTKLHVFASNASDEVQRAAAKYGVPSSAITVTSVPHAEMPARLAEVDATFCLIKTGFAVKASCPTKFGESLAAGAPVVVNAGVGDCDSIARDERVGVVVTGDRTRFDEAAQELLALLEQGEPMRARCRAVAQRDFALEVALDRYEGIYRSLTARS